MLHKRRGFTLIELLVVIAIIGILAAMVFPVFARARESARKVVCLSNVKNIALAIQMYLSDNNDTFWPHENRAEVKDEFWTLASSDSDYCQQKNLDKHNPYLRIPVILDEYTRNRDVWRCPSAMSDAPFYVLNTYGQDWWPIARDSWQQGDWLAALPCSLSFPSGWGGSVTDSLLQKSYNYDGFSQSVCVTASRGVKFAQIDDSVKYFVCGDGGAASKGEASSIVDVAWPDVCMMGMSNDFCGCYADWENCDVQTCSVDPSLDDRDPQVRKQYTRHLGGSNVGFADGHAKWFLSESLLNGCYDNPMGWRDWLIPADRLAARDDRELIISGGLQLGICGFPDQY